MSTSCWLKMTRGVDSSPRLNVWNKSQKSKWINHRKPKKLKNLKKRQNRMMLQHRKVCLRARKKTKVKLKKQLLSRNQNGKPTWLPAQKHIKMITYSLLILKQIKTQTLTISRNQPIHYSMQAKIRMSPRFMNCRIKMVSLLHPILQKMELNLNHINLTLI